MIDDATPVRQLICRMLLSGEDAREIADAIEASEIPGRKERDVFAFIGMLSAEGAPVSPKKVYQAAKAQAPGLAPFIHELALEAAHKAQSNDDDAGLDVADQIGWYRDWNTRRELRAMLEYRLQEVADGILQADTIVQGLAGAVEKIQSRRHDARSFDDIDEQLQRVSAYIRNPKPAGLPYGFRVIDDAMVPLLDGNLCLIGGPSGAGKSTVARNLFKNWRLHQPVYFSLEMSADDQLLHLACMECNISIAQAVKRKLTPQQQDDIDLAGLTYKKAGVRINERSTMTPVDLLRGLKRYRAAGFRLFIVDHLHRLEYGSTNDKELRLAIGTTAKRLKSFAVDTGSIVVALVQLTKQSRNDEPGDEAIRESNQILEEADKVFLTWRPLVIGKRTALGKFEPNWPRQMYRGQKLGKDTAKGEDETRIYIKPGKQRIAPVDTLFTIKFNHHSGQMFDVADRED